jgi:hypothetical protein
MLKKQIRQRRRWLQLIPGIPSSSMRSNFFPPYTIAMNIHWPLGVLDIPQLTPTEAYTRLFIVEGIEPLV